MGTYPKHRARNAIVGRRPRHRQSRLAGDLLPENTGCSGMVFPQSASCCTGWAMNAATTFPRGSQRHPHRHSHWHPNAARGRFGTGGESQNRSNRVTFFGDGAPVKATTTANFAASLKLPVVFCCQTMDGPSRFPQVFQSAGETFAQRASRTACPVCEPMATTCLP